MPKCRPAIQCETCLQDNIPSSAARMARTSAASGILVVDDLVATVRPPLHRLRGVFRAKSLGFGDDPLHGDLLRSERLDDALAILTVSRTLCPCFRPSSSSTVFGSLIAAPLPRFDIR